MNKDLRCLILEACRHGWAFEVGKNHDKLRKGDSLVIVAKTASDHRALMNIRSDIKRVERGQL